MPKSIPKKSYAGLQRGSSDAIELLAIGRVRSPHAERFGTPHQAVLPADPAQRPNEEAHIELFAERVPAAALQDLAGFSHVWVIAYLHLNHGYRPLVAPPRDPDRKHGVLATRAPHRPNPLGLSAARLLAVSGHRLTLERLDLLDGTPVLDIKPYVPYADAFPAARIGWLEDLPEPNTQS